MNIEQWVSLIVAILSGIATAIPLVVQLVRYIKKATKEKNWNAVLVIVMDLMKQAEENFDNGADRKEWVLSMIESMKDSINYDIDMTQIANLVDALCSLTKKVNAPTKE